MHSITPMMNLATSHKTYPTRLLLQEDLATKTGLIPGHDTPTPKWMDQNPPIIDTDMGDISIDHNHTTISTAAEAAAITKGTHHTPQSAFTVAHTTLWLVNTPIATHTATCTMGIVVLHLEHTTSPNDITHATIPQTVAGFTQATLTALHRDHSQWRRPSHTWDLQPPINPTVPRLSSTRTHHQILLQIETMTLIL